MSSKEEIEKAYWKGYIQKQNEAMKIFNQCKYIKKARELETREQKLIEKLEGDIECLKFSHDNYIDANIIEGTYETLGRLSYAQEILKILKGETNDKR